ncbi:unnamed protein product [Calicophoron daubneyi]|uniref:Uncharacterized protein n=1 Tax=Calicophoron daubneyi TaxID=300641 RepID=A0AAV2U295_CALDB
MICFFIGPILLTVISIYYLHSAVLFYFLIVCLERNIYGSYRKPMISFINWCPTTRTQIRLLFFLFHSPYPFLRARTCLSILTSSPYFVLSDSPVVPLPHVLLFVAEVFSAPHICERVPYEVHTTRLRFLSRPLFLPSSVAISTPHRFVYSSRSSGHFPNDYRIPHTIVSRPRPLAPIHHILLSSPPPLPSPSLTCNSRFVADKL